VRESHRAEVKLSIDDEEPDPDEVEELTVKLRRRLLELDVDAVDHPPQPQAPPGTRGIGTTLGSLVVTLGTPQLLVAVVSTIRSWLSGHGRRSVKIVMDGDTLELTGASSKEQEELIQAWIGRHTAPK
jgi:Effector Associated Constant Component 1